MQCTSCMLYDNWMYILNIFDRSIILWFYRDIIFVKNNCIYFFIINYTDRYDKKYIYMYIVHWTFDKLYALYSDIVYIICTILCTLYTLYAIYIVHFIHCIHYMYYMYTLYRIHYINYIMYIVFIICNIYCSFYTLYTSYKSQL